MLAEGEVGLERIHLDVYGRFDLLIERNNDEVTVYRSSADGRRRQVTDLLIPLDADVDEIVDLVDIAFHELARPGDAVRSR